MSLLVLFLYLIVFHALGVFCAQYDFSPYHFAAKHHNS